MTVPTPLLQSVGSKVLSLKQAVITAGVFEFLGAFLMGSHVTSAIRKILLISIFMKIILMC